MILEYINESTDILASKVIDEEITIEEACEAYNDITDKALTEYANEVLNCADEGILTATEASMLLELCGLVESDIYTEASYDLSSLSEKERKAVEDKLASLDPKARKKAEAALTKQYPSKEYKDKVAKRKKIMTGVGAAAALGTAGALAYGAHKFNQAENIALNTDKAYKAAKDKHAATMDKIDSTTLYGKSMQAGKEGKKAREQMDALRPKDRRAAEADYISKVTDANSELAGDIADIKSKKKARQGKLGYIVNTLKQAKEVKKIDKDLAKRLAANKADEEEERAWARGRKGKTLINKVKNAFRKDEDKLYDPGFTNKGIEKKLNADYDSINQSDVDDAEKKKEGVYKKKK